jgi:aminoglycoside phosphotransferase (APT) family kinase protein
VVTAAAQHLWLAPDPAIPSRDPLLAPETLTRHLSAVLGADIRGARLVRAKYRIGESLRVVVRLDVAGGEHLVAARTFPDGAAAAARAAVPLAVPAGPLRPVAHDPEMGAVWWAAPNDRRLRALPVLLDPPPVVAALHTGPGRWRAARLAELAPERSATAALLGDAGAVVGYGKAYAPGTVDVAALARRYAAVAAALAGHPRLRAPRAIAHSRDHDLLLLEAMPGERWDHLGPEDRATAVARLGHAIAVLHGVDPRGLGTRPFGRLRPDRVARSCDLVAQALPGFAPRVTAIAAALAARPERRDRPVLLHGDCHPKNALATPEGLALIDLDQAGVGQPAADVGSLLARLRHGAVLGETGPAEAVRLAAAFLDGYAAVRPLPDPAELRWSTAAALMAERAVRAVNRVHNRALGAMDGLLALAEDAVAEGWA